MQKELNKRHEVETARIKTANEKALRVLVEEHKAELSKVKAKLSSVERTQKVLRESERAKLEQKYEQERLKAVREAEERKEVFLATQHVRATRVLQQRLVQIQEKTQKLQTADILSVSAADAEQSKLLQALETCQAESRGLREAWNGARQKAAQYKAQLSAVQEQLESRSGA